MPVGITDVEVAIAAEIDVIFAEQTGEDAVDAWIIDQRGEIVSLIDKGQNAGTRCTVVRLAVMTTAMCRKNALKLLDNAVDPVAQQAGKDQVAEEIHKGDLLGSEL